MRNLCRREFMKCSAMAGVGMGLLSALANASGEQRDRSPNVIIINIDNHSKTMLSYYGNKLNETPNLDKLGEESVRFENYHTASRCAPARSALMTGRYHLRSGSIGTGDARSIMKAGVPTIGDYFRKAGYKTGSFGKWHMGSTYPYRPEDRGFGEVVSYPGSNTIPHSIGPGGKVAEKHVFRHNGVWEPYDGYRTDVWFREMASFIKTNKNQSFMAYLATWSTHGPNEGPVKFSEKYKAKLKALAPDYDLTAKKSKDLYGLAAEMESIDRNIGKLLEELEALGLRDNTIVIYMSDGPGAAAPKELFTATTDYEYAIPMFFSWPAGQLNKSVIHEGVANIDILPTLADICGIPLSKKIPVDGQSMYGLIKKGETTWKPRFYVKDHQSKGGDDRQVILRPLDGTTVFTPGGEMVTWNKGKLSSKDVSDQVVAEAEQYYQKWWDDVTSEFSIHNYVIAGTRHENPLYVRDNYSVENGPAGGGVKHYFPVEFAVTGTYVFSDTSGAPSKGENYGKVIAPKKSSDGILIVGDKSHKGVFPVTLQITAGKYLVYADIGNRGKNSSSLKIEKL